MTGALSAWRVGAYRAARPVLFTADPERIHGATLAALRAAGSRRVGRALCRVASGVDGRHGPDAGCALLGVRFRNRVGIGAGFDKDGVALPGWAALGVGFAEIGTVTPRPQPGNPRPRLFRLPADQALINRMGLNNAGADAAARRLAAARPGLPPEFVVGVSVGPNRDTPADAVADDVEAACRTVAQHADYVVINLSSPNTPGLRDLQAPDGLVRLVRRAAEATERPILVKLDPDLDDDRFDALLDALVGSPAAGVVLSNTTVHRARLRSPRRLVAEAGGLSGAPLRPRMLRRVARGRERCGGRLAIVASGGICTASDARQAVEAGADLVQLWTGLVYAGPGLIGTAVAATSRAR